MELLFEHIKKSSFTHLNHVATALQISMIMLQYAWFTNFNEFMASCYLFFLNILALVSETALTVAWSSFEAELVKWSNYWRMHVCKCMYERRYWINIWYASFRSQFSKWDISCALRVNRMDSNGTEDQVLTWQSEVKMLSSFLTGCQNLIL